MEHGRYTGTLRVISWSLTSNIISPGFSCFILVCSLIGPGCDVRSFSDEVDDLGTMVLVSFV